MMMPTICSSPCHSAPSGRAEGDGSLAHEASATTSATCKRAGLLGTLLGIQGVWCLEIN